MGDETPMGTRRDFSMTAADVGLSLAGKDLCGCPAAAGGGDFGGG